MQTHMQFTRTKSIKSVLITLFKVLLLSLVLTACIQNFNVDVPRYADKSSLMVSKSTIVKINRTFYGNFSQGNWNYKGAKARAGQVNAYIQIPQELNLQPAVQEKYLRDMICPDSSDLELWSQLKHVKLFVHLYTTSKSKSISATCVNPLKKNA